MQDTQTVQPRVDSSAVFGEVVSIPEKLKHLLLSLSRDPAHIEFRRILTQAAESVRTQAFGHNRESTKRRILTLLKKFDCLEIDDFTDETKIPEFEIKAALVDLVAVGMIEEGRRRRWQEPGKHYNKLYKLA